MQDTASHLGATPRPEGWILQVALSAPTAAHKSGLQHCLGLAQGRLAGQLQSFQPLPGCWQVTLQALSRRLQRHSLPLDCEAARRAPAVETACLPHSVDWGTPQLGLAAAPAQDCVQCQSCHCY